MMATPADLEDFGIGFSLTEGLVASAGEITGLEIVPGALGIEVRMWLRQPASAALAARRRNLAGPTGCGLCGIDSLTEAARTPPRVGEGLRVTPAHIHAALAKLAPAQALGAGTRAVHAAGLWTPADGLVALREDVGRHNALDKLAGALARTGRRADDGLLLLTSRVSVEMAQKAAMMGVQVLVAVSAPTALAVRTAEAAGMTLVAVARDDAFEVFAHEERITP
jgi:FdhD protein